MAALQSLDFSLLVAELAALANKQRRYGAQNKHFATARQDAEHGRARQHQRPAIQFLTCLEFHMVRSRSFEMNTQSRR